MLLGKSIELLNTVLAQNQQQLSQRPSNSVTVKLLHRCQSGNVCALLDSDEWQLNRSSQELDSVILGGRDLSFGCCVEGLQVLGQVALCALAVSINRTACTRTRAANRRSEERRVGKECVSRCRSRG